MVVPFQAQLVSRTAGITHLALGSMDCECWQCGFHAHSFLHAGVQVACWHAACAKMHSHEVYVCLSLGSSNGDWRQVMTVQSWDWTSATIARDAEKDPGSVGDSYCLWASCQYCIISHVYVACRVHGVRHWVSPATVRVHPYALLTVLGGSLTALPWDSSSAGAGT